MVEKGSAFAEDQHARRIVPDRTIAGVEVLDEAGCRQAVEGATVEGLLGESLVAVLTELAADEDQAVLFVDDEVQDVTAVRPALLQDLEAPALEVDPDALHCLGVDMRRKTYQSPRSRHCIKNGVPQRTPRHPIN